MSPEEAENAKRTGGLPDDFEAEVLKPFHGEPVGEIQRALQFFFTSTQYHTVGAHPARRRVAVIPGLDDVVNTARQVPTSVAQPVRADADLAARAAEAPDRDAPSLIVACGPLPCADSTRNEPPPRVNLLPHRAERRKRAKQHFFIVSGGTAIVGVLIVGPDAQLLRRAHQHAGGPQRLPEKARSASSTRRSPRSTSCATRSRRCSRASRSSRRCRRTARRRCTCSMSSVKQMPGGRVPQVGEADRGTRVQLGRATRNPHRRAVSTLMLQHRASRWSRAHLS
jgi:hypothetical protein